MSQVRLIDVDGSHTSAAVPVHDSRLFQSVHPRLGDVDGRAGVSPDDLRRLAHGVFVAGPSGVPSRSGTPEARAQPGANAALPTYRAPPAASGLPR